MFALYNSDAGFVAIANFCRIMLHSVHSGFVNLKTELLIQE